MSYLLPVSPSVATTSLVSEDGDRFLATDCRVYETCLLCVDGGGNRCINSTRVDEGRKRSSLPRPQKMQGTRRRGEGGEEPAILIPYIYM